MQESYVCGYWDELIQFLRGLFNSTFKDNPFLERALMTGITRVSKESIFSDLNHLKVITTTSDRYATCFGFTQEEVVIALEEAGIPEENEEVKRWYDGFTFGHHTDIYNPWSITNFLDEKIYAPYWADTSSNGLVSQLLQRGSQKIKETMELLLGGESFETKINEQIVFKELDKGEVSVWSLLLASGYLKILASNFDVEDGTFTYELGLTNKEVQIMFRKLILNWFSEPGDNYSQFTKSLLRGNVEDMNAYLQEVMDATVSSFDIRKSSKTDIREYFSMIENRQMTVESFEQIITQIKNEKADPESFYHALVLGMLVDLRKTYQVKSNRESGRGRYDVSLIPRDLKDGKTNAIIIEFKVFDEKKEKTIADTAKRALLQISEKKYDMELMDLGISKDRIRIYGFGFKGKEVLIEED